MSVDAPPGLYVRTLLIATFPTPFVLACTWAAAFLAFSSLTADRDLLWMLARVPTIALLVSVFLAPVGFLLGLVLVLRRRHRGPLSRGAFAATVALGTLAPFLGVGLLAGSFLFVAPLAVATPILAAAIYGLRHRLGIAALFDHMERPVDVSVFE